jgi:pyruvate/2-oxoglutarate dehydrogenase complex dihydrolipoamide dehydrogenase (E3) component
MFARFAVAIGTDNHFIFCPEPIAMNNPSPEKFDAIIIGAGQAGKPLALAGKGWNTALIERKFVGGICINYGCTPTKTIIASAHVAQLTRRSGEYGVHTGKVKVNLKEVKKRKDKIVAQFRKSIEKSFEEAKNLTLIYGLMKVVVDGQNNQILGAALLRKEGGEMMVNDSDSHDR